MQVALLQISMSAILRSKLLLGAVANFRIFPGFREFPKLSIKPILSTKAMPATADPRSRSRKMLQPNKCISCARATIYKLLPMRVQFFCIIKQSSISICYKYVCIEQHSGYQICLAVLGSLVLILPRTLPAWNFGYCSFLPCSKDMLLVG